MTSPHQENEGGSPPPPPTASEDEAPVSPPHSPPRPHPDQIGRTREGSESPLSPPGQRIEAAEDDDDIAER